MHALVTGAGRGLGLEFTRQLLAQGHTVVATARRPGQATALSQLGETAGGRLLVAALDVSRPDSIAELRASLEGRVPHLDLLVNNAGINSAAMQPEQKNVRFGSLEPEGFVEMVRVNAVGPALVTQALVDLLEQAPDGAKVLSISSWLGSVGAKTSGGNYAYCASKAMLNMVGRAMAFDLAPRGITCVVANPGWVATDMGGSRASLTPEQSVAGLLEVVAGLSPEDAGSFVQHDGSPHPW